MGFSEQQLEGMLRRVLVPVEPSPQFVTRLRGRLVHLRGGDGPSVWTLVAIGVGLILVIATWMGLALRMALALVGIFGLLGNRRTTRASPRGAR
jgi:hydrogenase/urease accessory protein HupE